MRQNPQRCRSCRAAWAGIYNNLGIVLEELRRTAEAVARVTSRRWTTSRSPARCAAGVALSAISSASITTTTAASCGDWDARTKRPAPPWPDGNCGRADPQHLFAVAEELALATGHWPVTRRQVRSCRGSVRNWRWRRCGRRQRPAGSRRRSRWQGVNLSGLKDCPEFAELVKRLRHNRSRAV